jgi:hypothetical protein
MGGISASILSDLPTGHHGGVGPGLPDGWESVAQRVTESYGHELLLACAPDAFNHNGSMIDVFLDGRKCGGIEFHWLDTQPSSQVLRELFDRVTELLAQELGSGN